MPLLEAHFFPSPSMMPWLSLKRWWPIRAEGKKGNNKKACIP